MRHKFKFQAALILLVTLALAVWQGPILAFIGGTAMANTLLFGMRGQCLGSNTISSELQLNTIMASAMTAFKRSIAPLMAFSTAFRNVRLDGTNKMLVPYYALETAASKDFNGTYQFDGSNTGFREVTIDKRKYQSLAITSAERARQPQLNPEIIGQLKGEKLAYDVILDVLSIFTLANYGAAVFTGAASTFDSDDIIDIAEACDTAEWPENGRSLILKNTYKTPVLKDTDIKNFDASGTIDPLTKGILPTIAGFTLRPTTQVPTNGENLVGIACLPSAAIIGFAPIEPTPEVMRNLSSYQMMEDPDGSGLVMEYRAWGDPDSDSTKEVIEVNYGYGKGEAAAAKRLVSA